ncbi:MAG TPA: type II toxin-antitoxin system RelE/ParE family toxin [Nitrospirae bacterium]|nr:type II toxin-antitoxin system RelE/ParE family toxin [Nitrospirota bacterium]
MQITLTESAVRDLEDIRDWYTEQGAADVGGRLVSEILQQVEGLDTHSEKGRIVPEFGQLFLRELIHPPFRIVYRIDAQTIRVVRVWRSERLFRFPPD